MSHRKYFTPQVNILAIFYAFLGTAVPISLNGFLAVQLVAAGALGRQQQEVNTVRDEMLCIQD